MFKLAPNLRSNMTEHIPISFCKLAGENGGLSIIVVRNLHTINVYNHELRKFLLSRFDLDN